MAITVRVCVQVGALKQYGFRSKLLLFTLNRQAMWAGLYQVPASTIVGKADREKLHGNRVRGGGSRGSEAIKHYFYIHHSGIPASGIPVVGQFWHILQSMSSARAESNKHYDRVKPSYTAYFDILTRESVFLVVGELRNTGSPFSLSDVFHYSHTFLARPHWPRAWHRLCVPDKREFKQQRFWPTYVNRKWVFFPFNMPRCYQLCIAKVPLLLQRRFTQRYVQYRGSRVQKVRFRLTFVVPKHRCINSQMTVFDCLPTGHHWRSQVDCMWRSCRRSVDRKHEHCFGW